MNDTKKQCSTCEFRQTGEVNTTVGRVTIRSCRQPLGTRFMEAVQPTDTCEKWALRRGPAQ